MHQFINEILELPTEVFLLRIEQNSVNLMAKFAD